MREMKGKIVLKKRKITIKLHIKHLGVMDMKWMGVIDIIKSIGYEDKKV